MHWNFNQESDEDYLQKKQREKKEKNHTLCGTLCGAKCREENGQEPLCSLAREPRVQRQAKRGAHREEREKRLNSVETLGKIG